MTLIRIETKPNPKICLGNLLFKVKKKKYIFSEIVALARKGDKKSCSSRAEIVNAYNNILGTEAIRSANTFTE